MHVNTVSTFREQKITKLGGSMKVTEHTQLWLPQARQSLNSCCVPCFDQQVAPQLVCFQLLYLAGFHTSSYFFIIPELLARKSQESKHFPELVKALGSSEFLRR